jgi:hypothetical protein
MKTLIFTLALLGMTGVGFGIYYSMPKQSSTEISVMWDVTDIFLAQPQANGIIPLYGLSSNKWNGAYLRFQNISSVSYNPVTEVSLLSANEWLSNEYERDNDITSFTGQVQQTIADSLKDKVGRRHSSIYLPIANELALLSQSSSQQKILLIYSDLMENDTNFSFYNKHIFTMLKNSPDKVREHFTAEQPLGNLHGIEVYLIYQPKNACTDLEYQVVSGFYKTMLESAGAKVTITANLTN